MPISFSCINIIFTCFNYIYITYVSKIYFNTFLIRIKFLIHALNIFSVLNIYFNILYNACYKYMYINTFSASPGSKLNFAEKH